MIKHITFIGIIPIAACLFSCSNNGQISDASGHFESDPVIVSAEMAGKLIAMPAEQGMTASQGMTMALTDTSALWLRIGELKARKNAILTKNKSIQANIDVIVEQKKNLQINIDRTVALYHEGAATRKQLDELTGQMEVLEKQQAATAIQRTAIDAETAITDAQTAILEDELKRCSVVNPCNGIVLETYARPGEMVTPGKPLYKIADLSKLTLKVYVSGRQLTGLAVGQNVTVLADSGDGPVKQLPGRITWISGEAEFTPKIIQTRDERVKLVYAIKIDVMNDGLLKIGMPGEVIFKPPG